MTKQRKVQLAHAQELLQQAQQRAREEETRVQEKVAAIERAISHSKTSLEAIRESFGAHSGKYLQQSASGDLVLTFGAEQIRRLR